jgi:hypothetical protein
LRLILFFAVPILLASVASAVPFTIAEPPDFQNFSPGPIVGTFGAGVNTLSGSVNGVSQFLLGDFQDSFRLNLPVGLFVTSTQLTITNFTFGGGPINQPGQLIYSGGFVSILGNGVYPLFSVPPGPQDFSFSPSYSRILLPPGPPPPPPNPDDYFQGGFSYSLSFQVVETPEPGSQGLALAGIAALYLEKRRKRRG